MGYLNTLLDDESLTDQPELVEEVIEDMLDSVQISKILTDLVHGNLSEKALYEKLYSLSWSVEQRIRREKKEKCGAV